MRRASARRPTAHTAASDNVTRSRDGLTLLGVVRGPACADNHKVRLLRTRPARLTIALSLSALALALLSACSSGSSHSASRAPSVHVQERDFRITVAPGRVHAGTVRLVIHNKGPDTHELLIVRSSRAGLPLRSDGLTINEAAVDGSTVAVMEGKEPGTTEHLVVHLKPGRYELFCNMAGHYLGGMRAELVVT